jgi:hypothetical protein
VGHGNRPFGPRFESIFWGAKKGKCGRGKLTMKVALILKMGLAAEPGNFQILERLSLSKYDLICILGRDCSTWEDIIDASLVGPTGNEGSHPVTTSHPNESLTEVEDFARIFFKNGSMKIEYGQA